MNKFKIHIKRIFIFIFAFVIILTALISFIFGLSVILNFRNTLPLEIGHNSFSVIFKVLRNLVGSKTSNILEGIVFCVFACSLIKFGISLIRTLLMNKSGMDKI